ncbi:MAG: ERF family protein [Caldilineaceae bacterium]|nr:ERF family protein [Caldilineaceae bacterium]
MSQPESTVQNKIAAAAAKISGVEKDQFNKGLKYHYASADSIFEACRRAIAEAGLSVWMDEESFNYDRETNLMTITYRIGLIDTPTPEDPSKLERQTFLHPYQNAQSRAQVATYVLKMYLRSKFIIPTGDLSEDIDVGDAPIAPSAQQHGKKGGGETRRRKSAGQARKAPAAQPKERYWKLNPDGTLLPLGDIDEENRKRALCRFVRDEIGKEVTQEVLQINWDSITEYLAQMPEALKYIEDIITEKGMTIPQASRDFNPQGGDSPAGNEEEEADEQQV